MRKDEIYMHENEIFAQKIFKGENSMREIVYTPTTRTHIHFHLQKLLFEITPHFLFSSCTVKWNFEIRSYFIIFVKPSTSVRIIVY